MSASAASAAAVAASSEGSLLAVIGDEDLVTGFLLAGVGNLDSRRKSNFLIVKPDTSRREMEDAIPDDYKAIEYQGEYIKDLITKTDYPSFDIEGSNQAFFEWKKNR